MYRTSAIVSGLILTVGVFMLPSIAPAVTIEELQVQVSGLITIINQLQSQLAELMRQRQGVVPPTGIANPNPSRPFPPPGQVRPIICERILNQLNWATGQGSHGEWVKELQEFLRTEGVLSVDSTGFFGPLTTEALGRWQVQNGLIAAADVSQGWGAFGPRTREYIRRWCGGDQDRGALKAEPRRGNAPLTVYFWHVIGGNDATGYSIAFGDGQTGMLEIGCGMPPNAGNAGSNACPRALTASHTYSADGTYTATLNKITSLCPNNSAPGTPRCMAPVQTEVVGKVQINVGPIACTKEYKPVCGSKQIYCITTPCNPIQQTYSNRCMAEADGATFVHEGQCRADYTNPADDPQCKHWSDGASCGGGTCSREVPGGQPMCAITMCMLAPGSTPPPNKPPYCIEYFENLGNKPPVISGFSGPTVLNVKQYGIWEVKASDPENGQLKYYIVWGDEILYVNHAMDTLGRATDSFVQNTTFTHSYSQAGTYTVTIVVQDDKGGQAKGSSTVRVGSGIENCTLGYAPVCGQPPEPACRHYVPACMAPTPGPHTYENRCYMNADGATFLYEGQCQSTVACPADAMQCPDGSWVGRTGQNCAFVCPMPQTTTDGSCVVHRHCGDLAVPNGGVAGNSRACGVVCAAPSQCVNGTFVQIGTYATPHQYETSCPDDPISR